MCNEITIERNWYNKNYSNAPCYIYVLKNSLNDEVFYVGKSRTPKNRKQVHISNAIRNKDCSENKGVVKAILEILNNGGDIVQDIIETIDYEYSSTASLRESYWINVYKNNGVELANILYKKKAIEEVELIKQVREEIIKEIAEFRSSANRTKYGV